MSAGFCHTSPDCGAKSMRAVTKDDDGASHTRNITGAAVLLLLLEQNYLQSEFTLDKNIKIHLHFMGRSDCSLHQLMT